MIQFRNWIFILPVFLVLSTGIPAFSQGRPESDQQWLGLSFEKKINKKWEAGLGTMLRMQNGVSRFRQNYYDLTIGRKMNKYLNLSAGYRFIIREAEFSHRIYVDFTGKFSTKFKKVNFTLNPRVRFQEQFTNGLGDFHIRTRLKFSVDRKKWRMKPYTAVEWSWGINSEYIACDRFRFALGFDVEITKDTEATLYYIRQIPYFNSFPAAVNVVGLGFNFKL